MKKKRFLALLLVLVMLVSTLVMGGCGTSSGNNADNGNNYDGQLVFDHSMELKYAKLFSVDYYKGGYKLLTITNRDEDTAIVSKQSKILLVPDGMSTPSGVATEDGKNIFADDIDKLGLSEDAYHFIAGVMKHAKGMTALTNPLVNSYKRLVPGYEAPVYIAWSAKNRSPLIRIPASRGNGTRVELRNPDPTANPYLVLALCLAAGLDGIKNKIEVPKSVDCNIYEMTPGERRAAGIENMPADLKEAVDCLVADEFLCSVLGEHITTKYVEAKMKEWENYTTRVSQWEIDEYLYKY